MCERTSSQVQVNDLHIPNFEPSRETWHISNSLAQKQKPVQYKLNNELKHFINELKHLINELKHLINAIT